jgi:hypothetical protein
MSFACLLRLGKEIIRHNMARRNGNKGERDERERSLFSSTIRARQQRKRRQKVLRYNDDDDGEASQIADNKLMKYPASHYLS